MFIVQETLHILSKACVYAFEFICVIVMLWGGAKTIAMLLRRCPHITLTFTRYMNIALLFKLAAEIVKLVYVQSLSELAIVAGIVLIHGAIAFLIHWETTREHDYDREQDAQVRETVEERKEDIFL